MYNRYFGASRYNRYRCANEKAKAYPRQGLVTGMSGGKIRLTDQIGKRLLQIAKKVLTYGKNQLVR